MMKKFNSVMKNMMSEKIETNLKKAQISIALSIKHITSDAWVDEYETKRSRRNYILLK